MTEREFIDKMIEGYKEGYNIGTMYVCHEIDCDECPLVGTTIDTTKQCRASEKTTPMLVNEIIRLREEKAEKVETNLEHYWKCLSIGFLSHNNEAYERYRKQSMALFDWILAPYEEPKRYQMSQLCYDMIAKWLERYDSREFGNGKGAIYVFIHVLIDMGLWHDWYDETSRNDIESLRTLLANAEVVEE